MSDSVTPGTVAPQAPLSMGFSRPEYWSGWPCPPPGDLPDPGIEPTSPMSQCTSVLTKRGHLGTETDRLSGKTCEETQGDDGHLQAKKRGRDSAFPHSPAQTLTPGLQEAVNTRCLNHPGVVLSHSSPCKLLKPGGATRSTGWASDLLLERKGCLW